MSYYTFKTRNKDHDHKSKPDSQHDVQDSQQSSQWEFPQLKESRIISPLLKTFVNLLVLDYLLPLQF